MLIPCLKIPKNNSKTKKKVDRNQEPIRNSIDRARDDGHFRLHITRMSKSHVITRTNKCGIEYKTTEMIKWMMSVSGRAHAQLSNIHHTKTLLYVPHERNYSCTSTYIYRNRVITESESSGRKGSVTMV